jgi:uncharacterized protein DUF6941
MPDNPVEQQPPDVLAMVLADAVLHDVGSGKFYINGTYSVIFANDFPVLYPLIVVYLAVTNGHGRTPIKVKLVDVDETREPIFENEGVLEFSDPLQVLETVFAVRGVRFPEPGEYRLQIFGAGQYLRERRLQVIPVPGTEGHHETERDHDE